MADSTAVEAWCKSGLLPSSQELIDCLTDDGVRFTDIEGQYWDFKEQWPFSYSDGYFGGICRLICAFSNSSGGIIVFGVHDKTRLGGKNKVRPNLDKLQLAFQQLTGEQFEYDFKVYHDLPSLGPVDALLIKPRQRAKRPYMFKRSLESYRENVIWVRSGSEVIRAEPSHYANLFLDPSKEHIEGSIPPSASQIKRFIGRSEAMTELFYWLQNSDEPRTYLYGKGGSGKTTIAWEFARLIRNLGGNILIEGENKIEIVLFLSAKEKELVSADSKVVQLDHPDFHDEESLLKKIISLSGGDPDLEFTATGDIKSYRSIVASFLDAFSYFIVIDDIDTLTTKGIDPGADFLYRTISRAKKRSKILYTTRNAPSQSLHNSIEVPGLEGDEYEKFVDECVLRFRTSHPSKDFRDTRLPRISERRPLVIESIVALSRTAGSFDAAERLFLQNVGDNVRDYVFAREWDALPDGLERPLLAALADLNRPTSFSDLKVVLQAGDSTIRDAIGSVREMFLSVDDAGTDTLFSLATLTRAFVDSRKPTLKLYPAIKERVSNFKKNVKIMSPEVVRMITQLRRFVPLRLNDHNEANLSSALAIVRDPTISTKVSEDPIFRAAKGYVEASQPRPAMGVVREDFNYAIQMRHEPEIEELIVWFNAEKNSQSIEDHLYRIADTVIAGRRYTEEQKIGMISRKATTAFNLAKQRMHVDSEQAKRDFHLSVLLHLRAFKLNAISGSAMLGVSEKYARNTADQWFRFLAHGPKWEVIAAILLIEKECDGYMDAIVEPLTDNLGRLTRSGFFGAERARLHAEAKRLASHSFERPKWMDSSLQSLVVHAAQSLVEATKAPPRS